MPNASNLAGSLHIRNIPKLIPFRPPLSLGSGQEARRRDRRRCQWFPHSKVSKPSVGISAAFFMRDLRADPSQGHPEPVLQNQLHGQIPQPSGVVWIDRVSSIPASEVTSPFCDLQGLVAVLEVETADTLKKRRCCQQCRRGGTLLKCLTPIGRRLEATRILLQSRRDCSRVGRIGTNAVICPMLGDADRKKGVSSLGPAVSADWRARHEVEIQIIKNHQRQMAAGAYRYDPGAVLGKRDVSKEVGAELKFEAHFRHRHDAGVVDNDVEWALPGINDGLDGPEILQIKTQRSNVYRGNPRLCAL